jgi:hypothetical protein
MDQERQVRVPDEAPRPLYLWCRVCKAWRPVRRRGAYAYSCHRCDWDLRARIVTKGELYRYWKTGEEPEGKGPW